VEQAPGDGVLDGRHPDDGGVALDLLIHLFEGRTTDDLHLFALEVLLSGNVVERPQLALYRYPLHIWFDALCAVLNGLNGSMRYARF
jgi:hypothetical protein